MLRLKDWSCRFEAAQLKRVPVELTHYFSVMPGLVPGIHVFLSAPWKRQTWMASDLGLARGPHSLSELQVGFTRLAVTSTAMTPRVDSISWGRAMVACRPGDEGEIAMRSDQLMGFLKFL